MQSNHYILCNVNKLMLSWKGFAFSDGTYHQSCLKNHQSQFDSDRLNLMVPCMGGLDRAFHPLFGPPVTGLTPANFHLRFRA